LFFHRVPLRPIVVALSLFQAERYARAAESPILYLLAVVSKGFLPRVGKACRSRHKNARDLRDTLSLRLRVAEKKFSVQRARGVEKMFSFSRAEIFVRVDT
jgi:hypothetical protein